MNVEKKMTGIAWSRRRRIKMPTRYVPPDFQCCINLNARLSMTCISAPMTGIEAPPESYTIRYTPWACYPVAVRAAINCSPAEGSIPVA